MSPQRRQSIIDQIKRQFLIHRNWIAVVISGAGGTLAVLWKVGACYLSLMKAVQTGQIDRDAILKYQADQKVELSTHIMDCEKRLEMTNARIDNYIVNR